MTDEAGIVDRDGRGLGVVAADLDDDGRVDLFVANDTTANYLFRNLGRLAVRGGRRIASGVAGNADGRLPGGHGGRLRRPRRRRPARPGRHQLLRRVDHLLPQPRRRPRSPTRPPPSAWPPPSRYLLGFGIAFLDANNDGRLDLATANGHVNDFRPDVPYAMPAQLLARRRRAAGWSTSPTRPAPPWQVPRIGRGLAVGDLDNDGRVDLLILSQNEPLAYFHNQGRGGHWLTLRLEGTASNRDAIGARVVATAESSSSSDT